MTATTAISPADATHAQALTSYAQACYARAARRGPGRQAAIETNALHEAGDRALEQAQQLLHPGATETPWAAPATDPDTEVACPFAGEGCHWTGRAGDAGEHARTCDRAPF
jgi:hypothetical protein